MGKLIPEGYKQTEVGVIPADWDISALGDLVKIRSGESPSCLKFAGKGFPYFKVDELNNSEKFAAKTKYFISAADKLVPKGSLIFPKRGASIFQNKIRILKNDSYMDTNLMTLTVSDSISNEYCYYQLNYIGLSKVADTTSVPQINNKHIKPFNIPFPLQLEEQQAIATALSDVDNLITSLEQLIEKKKAIKQGAMQELLTGRRRLPGFGEGKGYKQTELGMIPEDWEVKRLHELGEFQSGIGFPLYLQGKHQEVIPFYKVSDMNNNGNEVLMLNSNNYISKKDLVKLRTTIVPRSSIVFAKIGAALFLERKRILLVDSLIDNNMMAIIADIDNIDVKYLYYLLMNTKLSKYANTTALPSINRNDIGEIKFKIPSLHEQEAITQVLTNMDSEIEKLESKVDKYKQIKQGMMQNLLTGRIRLK